MADPLLDTHAFLWWLTDDRRLKRAARTAIAKVPFVYVSAAFAWEAAVKSALERLALPAPFHEDVDASGFEELPITIAHAAAAGGLPPHHADPFDGMLIAQANTERLVLVSHDRRFEPYDVKLLWTWTTPPLRHAGRGNSWLLWPSLPRRAGRRRISPSPRRSTMDARQVDHIGIAVKDLEKALSFWRDRLGLPLEGIEDVAEMKVRVAKLRVGETRIELLCPLAGEEAVTKFLEKRGEGVHHVCLAVPDADAATTELKGTGVSPVYEAARKGAGGHRVNFLSPKDTGGVLIEVST